MGTGSKKNITSLPTKEGSVNKRALTSPCAQRFFRPKAINVCVISQFHQTKELGFAEVQVLTMARQ